MMVRLMATIVSLTRGRLPTTNNVAAATNRVTP